MQIDVKSQADDTNVGVLTVIHGPFRTGHILKVYNERRHGEELILYCTGNPGGYAGQAVLTNGNFKPGDRLIVEAVRP